MPMAFCFLKSALCVPSKVQVTSEPLKLFEHIFDFVPILSLYFVPAAIETIATY